MALKRAFSAPSAPSPADPKNETASLLEKRKSLPAYGSIGSDGEDLFGHGPSSDEGSYGDYIFHSLARGEDEGSRYWFLDDGRTKYSIKIPKPEQGTTTRASCCSVSDLWERVKGRSKHKSNLKELTEEQRLRYRLDYHFMTPFQKYRRGRRPWKLCIQMLKILIVTLQVSLFSLDRFACVSFYRHTHKSYEHLFLLGWDESDGFSYYSRQDVVNAIEYACRRVSNNSIGTYWYPHSKEQDSSRKANVRYCVNYDKSVNKPACSNINFASNVSSIVDNGKDFDNVVSIKLNFFLESIFLTGLKFHHRPECFLFNITITLNDQHLDGRMRVSLTTLPKLIRCTHLNYIRTSAATIIKYSLVAFDIFVIVICFISCLLCIRSLIKSIHLAKKTKKYFEENKNETLTKWDMAEFVSKWFPVIVISDCLSISGSFYKVYVDNNKDLRFYNDCSILLGLGVVLVWIGLLRFLSYLKAYNILLITLRTAAPSLFRFMLCALLIFFGFSFCGWVVLGPYHPKFNKFLVTLECLFSLLNGDDMFPSFAEMAKTSLPVWIFSKLYLYIFISLFMYVVLSTFIGIVGDTYERLKDWGELPQTRIQQFIEGKTRESQRQRSSRGCHRCARSRDPSPVGRSSLLDDSFETSRETLSVSQLSLDSASWE